MTALSVVDSTSSRAGLRKTTRTRRASRSSAIGKFERCPWVGMVPATSPLPRSTHRDLPCIRQVDEGSCAVLVDLETFRVRLEPDVGHFRLAIRVDDGERALAVPDDHPVARQVDPNVVGIVAKVDAPQERQISARSIRTDPSPPFAT